MQVEFGISSNDAHTRTHAAATITICGSLRLSICIDTQVHYIGLLVHIDHFSAPKNALITLSQINNPSEMPGFLYLLNT